MLSKMVHDRQIIIFVTDLMIQVQLEKASEQLGYQAIIIEKNQKFLDPQHKNPRDSIVDYLTQLSPGLIIFDIGVMDFPWPILIPILKSDTSYIKDTNTLLWTTY